MTDITAAVNRILPSVLDDLADLVKIPSVSSDPAHAHDVERSAQFVASKLQEIGCPSVEVVAEGGKPAVIGRFPTPAGMPTVVLYAHHDVQPTGGDDNWASEPFSLTERDGRLYGRGAADDKGGVGAHLAALKAFDGKPPVGVTVFIEGEEEIGSPSLSRIFAEHGDKLRGDVFLITDSTNWSVGEPAFTTSLRGMAKIDVTVSTLDHILHSGQHGGVVPDAMMATTRLLDTLWAEDGSVAVQGLGSTPEPAVEYPADRLRTETAPLEGVEFIGQGSLAHRMWGQPSITIIGIDAPTIAGSASALTPSVKVRLSARVAPGDTPENVHARIAEHLTARAPWGAHVKVELTESGRPTALELTGPVADAAQAAWTEAFGVAPVEMGMGGSIPLTQEYRDLFPDAQVLICAVVDPDSRMHGIDESLHRDDFAKVCRAEALFLAELATANTQDRADS